ncbi:uncharacterized protein N7483_002825 [Penicillium malachiteum]|uniref:uncharacterized protein n=1 Tax=Penicillium malachiteum TaxID=1324776 RepID=UPI002547935C|nr:uncharacterized protein N7483_002825 [Penicillium malachiteum]KAJ5737700.1 hypothetical protein N7483_002825 [Penicillium malachiteum]
MKDNISDNLRQQLERRTHPNKLLFTDTTYNAIVQLVEGKYAFTDGEEIWNWFHMTPSDFPSISDYIDNLMSTAVRLNYHPPTLSPGTVMKKVIGSLDSRPVLKMRWKYTMQEIEDDESAFTEKDLWEYVNLVHQELRHEETAAGANDQQLE